MSAPRVHRFASTGEAYDDSQTGYFPDDWLGSQDRPIEEWEKDMIQVADGDVLVVESEKAVAVMVEAWPVAVDAAHSGEAFHTTVEEWDWKAVPRSGTGELRDYSESAELARAEAAKL